MPSTSTSVHYLLSEFEATVDGESFPAWVRARPMMPVTAALIYLTCIPIGKTIMYYRKPFDLRLPLVVWNSVLAVFSAVCCIRLCTPIVHEVRQQGLEQRLCTGPIDGPALLWGFCFLMSKLVELGDTGFLIARKRPLPFLHWYHHTSVLLFTWYSYGHTSRLSDTFAGINAAVHSLMYAYFALKGMNVRLPRIVSMMLTGVQILQMVMGMTALSVTWNAERRTGARCNTLPKVWIAGFLMYASYLVLFVRFFLTAYVCKHASRDPNNNEDRLHHKVK